MSSGADSLLPPAPTESALKKWLLAAHIDLPLFGLLLATAVLGLFALYSAADRDQLLLTRQAIYLLVAFAAMLLAAQIPPDMLKRWTPRVFVLALAMLGLVLIVGDEGKGAQRWLDFGIRFQPSELMKIAMPLMVAAYLHNRRLPPRIHQVIIALALIGIPVALILRQPDLGTALMIFASGLIALFLAGLRWWIIVLAVCAGIAAILALLYTDWLSFLLHDYQRQRILTFLNPEEDPLNTGYHIIQSKIAIGSGGLFGKGWLNGTQSHLDFLPERSTDFIFAVFAEEFGLLGVAPLLLVYLAITLRGLQIAARADHGFDRLICASISLTFFLSVFINIGMVCGLLPVVGVPLPLISRGGTSMVTLLIGFGILMSVHTHKKLLAL